MINKYQDELSFRHFRVKKIADITGLNRINDTKIIHAIINDSHIGISRNGHSEYLTHSDVTVALESLEEHLISILIEIKQEKKKYLGALL